MNEESTPLKITFEKIWDRLCNENSMRDDMLLPFLPKSVIDNLVTEVNIMETLSPDQHGQRQRKETEDLARYIVNHAKKIFLCLVMESHPHEIRSIYKDNVSDEILPLPPAKETWPCLRNLDYSVRQNFFDRQWLFLAPALGAKNLSQRIQPRVPIPLISYGGDERVPGGFGVVTKIGLRTDHYQGDIKQFHLEEIRPNEVVVAVKTLLQGQNPVTDIDKFYEKELGTLIKMRQAKHDHLVQMITAFERGQTKCFVFPWADNGDLDHFWNSREAVPDRHTIKWAVGQMKAISDGIKALHKAKTRHGDLKPKNILLFRSQKIGESLGRLVVADVGISKFHPEYTHQRQDPTTAKYATQLYVPPDTFLPDFLESKKISRTYDTWSLGCLFLEFITWLLYGYEGVRNLRNDLAVNDGTHQTIKRYWKISSTGTSSPVVHPAVEEWITKIRQSGLKNDCPLRELALVIKSSLLVPVVANRKTTAELVEDMEMIYTKIQVHNLEECCCAIATAGWQVSVTAKDPVHGEPDRNLSRYNPYTTPIRDKWENVTDHKLAQDLLSKLDCKLLRPDIALDKSQTCSDCSAICFWSRELKVMQRATRLEGSDQLCIMCSFLSHCLSPFDIEQQHPITLIRNDRSNGFRLPQGETDVITIYSDPCQSPSNTEKPVYSSQIGIPILPEMGSTEQSKLLKEWIRICDETHDCALSKEDISLQATLPTRLIYIENGGAELRVHLTRTENHAGLSCQYVALSHRWGEIPDDQRVCTNGRNLEAFQRNIPYQTLPKSFQDAVKVTIALGISYLWIDSLCIIQDDDADWQREAARMEDVFANAHVTLAATSAYSSLDGFLRARSIRPCVRVQTSQGPIHLAKGIDDFRNDVEKGILNTRGWVFQERALSRRTIHFTSTQIYWECGQGVHCETLAQLRNSQSQFLGDAHFPQYGLQFYRDDRIRLVQHLYQEYCELKFTQIRDRSKAILGVERRLTRLFKHRAEHGILWNHMERMLLWRAQTPGQLSRIAATRRVTASPSWSWMSRAGSIRYLDIGFSTVSWQGNVENPFMSREGDDAWNGSLIAHCAVMVVDHQELSQRIILDSQENWHDISSWRCIVLGKDKVAGISGKVSSYILVIRRVSSSSPLQTYERIGVGVLYDFHISTETTLVHLM